MSAANDTRELIKGAEWLIKESSPASTFTSEQFGEEELMIRDMCTQFLAAEVMPILDRIDSLEEGLMKSLVQKAGTRVYWQALFPKNMADWAKTLLHQRSLMNTLERAILFQWPLPPTLVLAHYLFYILGLKSKSKNISPS